MEETEIVKITIGIQLIKMHRTETAKMIISTESTDHTERIVESGTIEITSASIIYVTEMIKALL